MSDTAVQRRRPGNAAASSRSPATPAKRPGPPPFTMRADHTLLRPGTSADLNAANDVIEQAIRSWNLPERVKRLALPIYRYSASDFHSLQVIVAEDPRYGIVALAGFEPADFGDTPHGHKAALLHGIYVLPDRQNRGIGSRLLESVETEARARGFTGLLVRAQAGAEGFFVANGLERLPVHDPGRDYRYRYWKRLDESSIKPGANRRTG
ncbi:GNAT family N-acetyltransferase [Thiogranum longum]